MVIEPLSFITPETLPPFIYGLVDPLEEGHVRYVGMAHARVIRPYDHARNARKDDVPSTHFMNWVRKLHSEGRDYCVLVLEQLADGTTREFLGFVESCYISSLKEIGHQLTNATDGGDGGPYFAGHKHTDKTRAEMSAIALGRPKSDETRQRMSDTWKQMFISDPELREQRRITALGNQNMLGKTQSEETRALIAASKTPEVRAHQSALMRGNTNRNGSIDSEETRANKSISRLNYYAKLAADGTPFKHPEGHRANVKAACNTPEERARRSAAAKAQWARRKQGAE